jgi:hypothetical protein
MTPCVMVSEPEEVEKPLLIVAEPPLPPDAPETPAPPFPPLAITPTLNDELPNADP